MDISAVVACLGISGSTMFKTILNLFIFLVTLLGLVKFVEIMPGQEIF